MQMKNGLSGSRAGIDHCTISGVFSDHFPGNLPGGQQHVTQQRGVFGLEFIEGRDMFARDDQKMDRRYRVNILDYDDLIVFVENFRG